MVLLGVKNRYFWGSVVMFNIFHNIMLCYVHFTWKTEADILAILFYA